MKYALSIRTSHLDTHFPMTDFKDHLFRFNHSELFLWGHSGLIDRAIVDGDDISAEDWRQLILYVTATDNNGRYLTYQRPASGGESKLHGKRSMGFGGHVDFADVAKVLAQNPNATIIDVLYESAERELIEELGIDMRDTSKSGQAPLVIVENSTAVGRRHLGITHQIYVDANAITAAKNEVVDLKWVELEEIRKNADQYEGWSRILATHIVAN